MEIEEIKSYLLQNFDKLQLAEVENDLFFMHKKNDKVPFATIITKDNEYDAVSNLNREGFFRLNFCVDKDTIESLFKELPKSKKLEAYMHLGIDFTKEDTLMPHPTYGSMNWVCIVQPSRKTFETFIEKYLKQSYQKIN
ncbi:DUF6194 family protein [Dyadobacter tibetensis]|uniref:DUF6194 family protein n=1 Tax=Dyadobacter tibetensis TaxID=1211851 RepID=UPI00046FCC60|nr:DUF6194 family protein [Dyadobacter tibetensis]